MFSITEEYYDETIPELSAIVSSPPQVWQGLPINWRSEPETTPVILNRILFSHDGISHLCILIGLRYDLSEMLLAGKAIGKGYFIEYVVAEKQGNQWHFYRLIQNESVTFSNCFERRDYICLDEIGDVCKLSITRTPVWQDELQAVWPTLQARPMLFIGQITLPETVLTRQFLTWDKTIYIFWKANANESVFKIVMQDSNSQTAEEHYKDEE